MIDDSSYLVREAADRLIEAGEVRAAAVLVAGLVAANMGAGAEANG